MNSCPSSETKPQRRVAPCRFCQLGKWRRLNWTDVPPYSFRHGKNACRLRHWHLLMLTSLHYGNLYGDAKMCLIGWMNLRKVHPWTEIILVASCVRQLTTKVHIISKNQLFQFSLSMWELGLSKKSVQVIVNSQSCMSYLLEINQSIVWGALEFMGFWDTTKRVWAMERVLRSTRETKHVQEGIREVWKLFVWKAPKISRYMI